MQKVFILGAYGQHNVGDEALLEVFLSQFPGWQIIANSARPDETEEQYCIKAVPTYRLGWPRLRRLRAMMSADLLVFGGGSLLKEIEGGTVRRILYLLRILFLVVFARLTGRRVAMLGVGIGPLEKPIYKWFSRLAARFPDLICVRDNASAQLLREIGVKRPVYVTADPVFMYESAKTTGTILHAPPEELLVVVIPRYTLSRPQVEALANTCNNLIESHGVRVLLLPFQTGYIDKFNEVKITGELRALLHRQDKVEVLIPQTPTEAMAVFKEAALVISCRLHGLIFGAKQGVPLVALNYEVKIRNLMQELGQSAACLSLAEVEQGKLDEVVETVWQNRQSISGSLAGKLAPFKAQAGRTFELLKDLLDTPVKGGLLRGGALLFISMTIVNAGNYLFNLVLGRWLGPEAFAELSLIITLFLVITFFTSTFQTVAARFSAIHTADENSQGLANLRRWMTRSAWGSGLTIAALFILSLPLLLTFFQSSQPLPFIFLAATIPFYLAQGVDRGALQGQTRFGLLSLSYQAEMWVRLLLAVVLVALGLSVNGAAAALLISVIATWAVARQVRKGLPNAQKLPRPESRAITGYAGPVSLALVGQILINNSDIIIVKHFFETYDSGLYASVALIGRIVFFATWSVVTTLFPIVAQRERKGQPHRHLLTLGLVMVGSVSGIIILATLVAPELIMQVLFGDAYISAAPRLAPYALATALYALGNVIISYRLSTGVGGGSVFGIMAGILQVGGLWFFHQSLSQVILVQVVIMAGMFALLVVWDIWLLLEKKLSIA